MSDILETSPLNRLLDNLPSFIDSLGRASDSRQNRNLEIQRINNENRRISLQNQKLYFDTVSEVADDIPLDQRADFYSSVIEVAPEGPVKKALAASLPRIATASDQANRRNVEVQGLFNSKDYEKILSRADVTTQEISRVKALQVTEKAGGRELFTPEQKEVIEKGVLKEKEELLSSGVLSERGFAMLSKIVDEGQEATKRAEGRIERQSDVMEDIRSGLKDALSTEKSQSVSGTIRANSLNAAKQNFINSQIYGKYFVASRSFEDREKLNEFASSAFGAKSKSELADVQQRFRREYEGPIIRANAGITVLRTREEWSAVVKDMLVEKNVGRNIKARDLQQQFDVEMEKSRGIFWSE